MATRTLKVEFGPEFVANGIGADPVVHDITIDAAVTGVPEILENPHVDFPGTWRLTGEGASGAHRYEKVADVADTSSSVAL